MTTFNCGERDHNLVLVVILPEPRAALEVLHTAMLYKYIRLVRRLFNCLASSLHAHLNLKIYTARVILHNWTEENQSGEIEIHSHIFLMPVQPKRRQNGN